MITRPRILRQSESIRSLIRETKLSLEDFIAPIFIVEGENIEEKIPSLPGYHRRSLDLTVLEVNRLYNLGIRAVLLFIKCPQNLKDNLGTEVLNEMGLMQRSIRAIKSQCPSICIMSDVALDPYSSFGHDGVVEDQEIVNDKTIDVLTKMALSHAKAGVNFVAPSDMMDGRIGAIRKALESENYHNTGIMSYAVKYASCFYGPFRDALDSAPGFGNKKTYQMDPANRQEAIKEAALDLQEGADILMIKPALAYLDIIREVKNSVQCPIAAYHVSGEYAMIKAAAEKKWLDEDQAILETTLSIKRAGANLIATYFINDLIRLLP